MNYFFSISNKNLKPNLTIPNFRNDGVCDTSYIPYKAEIRENKWKIKKAKYKIENNCFVIKEQELKNDTIFFLDRDSRFLSNNKINFENEINNYNNYTDTIPKFRANLRISIPNGGFSSYQSEYPYEMVIKRGEVLSPISILLNKKADRNILFFRNIFFKPIYEKFYLYFINIKNKKIILKKKCLTNSLNEIEVKNNFIDSNVYLFTEKFIGIPMFVSIMNNHISFEHTHPPQLYLFSNRKFERIKNIKDEFNEIINKKNSKF